MDRLEDVRTLTEMYLEEHGLLAKGWSFCWIGTTSTLGRCSYADQTIAISLPFAKVNEEAVVEDTIRHEIAHALAGAGAKHGPAWRAHARALGIVRPRARCTVGAQKGGGHLVAPPSTRRTRAKLWRQECPSCGKVYERATQPRIAGEYRCRCAARAVVVAYRAGERPADLIAAAAAAPAPPPAWRRRRLPRTRRFW